MFVLKEEVRVPWNGLSIEGTVSQSIVVSAEQILGGPEVPGPKVTDEKLLFLSSYGAGSVNLAM